MSDDVFVGPCGNCACEKYADCAYCVKCVAQDPWAQASAEANEDARWERDNAGSFGDWIANR